MAVGVGMIVTVLWFVFGMIINFYKIFIKKKKIDPDFYKNSLE